MNPLCPVCAKPAGAADERCPHCTAELKLRDRFFLQRLLGGGAQGQTFAALDTTTGARVAIKELSLAWVRDWKSVDLFRREASVLAALRHPAIPKLIDYFEIERSGITFFYLAQEFIDGETLQEALARGERFDETKVRAIARSILEILEYLHGQSPSIIHRDIKPSNLMRNEDGRIMLIDFGVVRDVAKPEGGSTISAGTPGYAPLEQFAGMATPQSDLYSLGASMVALLARREPAAMIARPAHRLDFHPYVNVGPDLLRFLDRLLQPSPEDRYGSAAEALRDLETTLPTEPPRQPQRRPQRQQQRDRPPQPELQLGRIWLKLFVRAVIPVAIALPALYFSGVLSATNDFSAMGCASGRLLWMGGPPRIATIQGVEVAVALVRVGSADELYVVAIRPGDLSFLWKLGPFGTYSQGYQSTVVAIAGGRVAVSDFRSQLHIYDLESGKETATLALSDRVKALCSGPEESVFWARLADENNLRVEPQSGTAMALAERPKGCLEWDWLPGPSAAPLLKRVPRVDGFEPQRAWIEGDIGIAAGVKKPGTPIPRIVGFDPKTRAIRWQLLVGKGDPSSVREEVRDALAAGKYYAAYGVGPSKGWHLAAFDALTGARLWDHVLKRIFAVDWITGMVATDSYVYVVRTSSLDVYRVKTGELVGAVGNETYE